MTSLVLGTAQFGTAYGVTNTIGRLADSDVSGLIAVARAGGIDTFDTAADYGDSQLRLGALAGLGNRYITKFSFPTEGAVGAEYLFGGSAATLGVHRLAGVMFHKVSDLLDPRAPAAIEVLREARSSGLIERAGVSVYDVKDLEQSLAVFPDLDLVQLPANLVDRRLIDHDLVTELRQSGAEIHARSAFLQGILLADPAALPQGFELFRPIVVELDRLARAMNVSRSSLALGFLRDSGRIDGVVVGATTIAELADIVTAWAAPGLDAPIDLPSVPTGLLDPRSWKR